MDGVAQRVRVGVDQQRLQVEDETELLLGRTGEERPRPLDGHGIERGGLFVGGGRVHGPPERAHRRDPVIIGDPEQPRDARLGGDQRADSLALELDDRHGVRHHAQRDLRRLRRPEIVRVHELDAEDSVLFGVRRPDDRHAVVRDLDRARLAVAVAQARGAELLAALRPHLDATAGRDVEGAADLGGAERFAADVDRRVDRHLELQHPRPLDDPDPQQLGRPVTTHGDQLHVLEDRGERRREARRPDPIHSSGRPLAAGERRDQLHLVGHDALDLDAQHEIFAFGQPDLAVTVGRRREREAGLARPRHRAEQEVPLRPNSGLRDQGQEQHDPRQRRRESSAEQGRPPRVERPNRVDLSETSGGVRDDALHQRVRLAADRAALEVAFELDSADQHLPQPGVAALDRERQLRVVEVDGQRAGDVATPGHGDSCDRHAEDPEPVRTLEFEPAVDAVAEDDEPSEDTGQTRGTLDQDSGAGASTQPAKDVVSGLHSRFTLLRSHHSAARSVVISAMVTQPSQSVRAVVKVSIRVAAGIASSAA